MTKKRVFAGEVEAAIEADLIEQLRLSHLLAETSLTGLAADYECSHGTIWRAERGELDDINSTALTPKQIAEIKEKRTLYHATREAMDGYRMKAISERHNVCIQTLYRYLWRIKDRLGSGRPISDLWEAA